MRRDRRLLIAMLLFAGSLTACAIQIWITALYIDASMMGHWAWFAETFGVSAPASGPNVFCFDSCAPDLPFAAGWIAVCTFLAGWVMLANAWCKPRSTELR